MRERNVEGNAWMYEMRIREVEGKGKEKKKRREGLMNERREEGRVRKDWKEDSIRTKERTECNK